MSEGWAIKPPERWAATARDPAPGALELWPRPEGEGPALALAFRKAASSSSLQGVRRGQSAYCHIPAVGVVTKMETHHMSLKSPSRPTSSKSLGNAVLFRKENR